MLCAAVVKHGKYAPQFHTYSHRLSSQAARKWILSNQCVFVLFCFILRTPINALARCDRFICHVRLSTMCLAKYNGVHTSVCSSRLCPTYWDMTKTSGNQRTKTLSLLSVKTSNVSDQLSVLSKLLFYFLLFFSRLPEETSLGDLIQAKIELLRLGEQTTMKWCRKQ